MIYGLTFLEGILTFISPCLLPLLPAFVSYFAGRSTAGEDETTSKNNLHVLVSALWFVAGFTLIFVILGVFAGSIGALLNQHQTIVNLAAGGIVVLFGLSYMGLFRLPGLNLNFQYTRKKDGVSSFLFGIVFSIGWTPCISVFLGAALLKAAAVGSWYEGALLLFAYSLGMGIPLVICALLIDQLKGTFGWIKANYKIITFVSGFILVIMGILIMSGLMTRWLNLLA